MADDRGGSQPLSPWRAWRAMFGIRAPLSGDVTENIAPSIGGQLGLLNINNTRSGDPGKEQAALDQVDRIVAEVQALSRDPQANADVIRRVREALP
ncbi:MAG: hypothetical protein DLM60_11980 [Pseudonocardiales bacterium]|nr:MAG: hypothetical protein DLM60_11980 [Pseudonocardiales bacterium]